MDNTREKLIDILTTAHESYYSKFDPSKTYMDVMADHLIANGVIIKSDCEDCASQTTRFIDKLHGEIAKLRNAQQWIPVTERLPKPYMDVITLRKNLLSQEYQSCGLEYVMITGIADIPSWSKDNVTWKTKVTHWMPLPEPPSDP